MEKTNEKKEIKKTILLSIVLILIIVGSIGLDQLTKIIICNNLGVGDGVPFIKGVVPFMFRLQNWNSLKP